jgi:hypothetical protein
MGDHGLMNCDEAAVADFLPWDDRNLCFLFPTTTAAPGDAMPADMSSDPPPPLALPASPPFDAPNPRALPGTTFLQLAAPGAPPPQPERAAGPTPTSPHLVAAAAAPSPTPPPAAKAAQPQPPHTAAPRGKPARPSQRGKHLAGKPELSKPARDGHQFWAERVLAVRGAWDALARRDPAFRARYGRWADLAALRAGGKLESLLRTLHLAAAAGLIHPILAGDHPPAPAPAGGERKGRPPGVVGTFCDWYGFAVAPAAAGEFRRAVRGLFPEEGLEETVVATLRQSGLAPEGWQSSPRGWPWADAWAGAVPFVLRASQ